jgi:hypothetical protein
LELLRFFFKGRDIGRLSMLDREIWWLRYWEVLEFIVDNCYWWLLIWRDPWILFPCDGRSWRVEVYRALECELSLDIWFSAWLALTSEIWCWGDIGLAKAKGRGLSRLCLYYIGGVTYETTYSLSVFY